MKKIVLLCVCSLLISSFSFVSTAKAEDVTFSNVQVTGSAPDSFILEYDTNIADFNNVSFSASAECVSNGNVGCASLTENQVPVLTVKPTHHKFYISGGVGTWLSGNKVWYQISSSALVILPNVAARSQVYEYTIPDASTKLTISNFTSESGADSITISWQTNRPATSKIYLKSAAEINYPDKYAWAWSKSENLKYSDNNLTQNHQYTITGLNKETQYALNIENFDSNNNYASNLINFHTLSSDAFVISNETAQSITSSNARISWYYGQSRAANTIYVEYGKTTAYGQKADGDCVFTAETFSYNNCHAILSNLESNSLYHYRVVYELQNFSDHTFNTTTPPTTTTPNTTTPPTTTTPTTTPTSTTSSAATQFVQAEKALVTQVDTSLVNRVNGYILLQVQEHGEAWYVEPTSDSKFYLPDGTAAYSALRKFGLGITNADLAKIPVGIESRFQDIDTDGDGLPDKLEEGLGTNPSKSDTDGDGFSDLTEIQSGYNPLGSGNLTIDTSLANRIKGRIVLQVQSRGEAWYINPKDGKRYYMKDGDAAYQIMRFLSLGITNSDLRTIPVGTL